MTEAYSAFRLLFRPVDDPSGDLLYLILHRLPVSGPGFKSGGQGHDPGQFLPGRLLAKPSEFFTKNSFDIQTPDLLR